MVSPLRVDRASEWLAGYVWGVLSGGVVVAAIALAVK